MVVRVQILVFWVATLCIVGSGTNIWE